MNKKDVLTARGLGAKLEVASERWHKLAEAHRKDLEKDAGCSDCSNRYCKALFTIEKRKTMTFCKKEKKENP